MLEGRALLCLHKMSEMPSETAEIICWLNFIIYEHFKEALFSIYNFEKLTLSIFKMLNFFFFGHGNRTLRIHRDDWETRWVSCV